MTKSELLAQADALEWAATIADDDVGSTIGARAMALRAQAAAAEAQEPVAYASPGWTSGNGRCIRHLGQRSILETREDVQFTPLYAHPDPRIAELVLLSKAISADCNTTALERNAANARLAKYRELLTETLAWLHEDAGVKKRIRAALKGGE